ncbi:MAG: hypothetical protein LBV29_02805 [Azoarcus sp.]|jgi:nitrous oxide reductase accessory protein NosL|nr:hypothetical protein [Azoarcus sp.]
MLHARFFVLAALVVVFVAACGKRGNWPEGMVPIHWDRDTCAQCNMAISDPRFAVELVRNVPKKTAFKFDDIGCLVVWTNALSKKTGARPWWEEPDAHAWVADFSSPVENRDMLRWLDVRLARYIERTSPMGYNLAAVGETSEETVGFDEVQRRAEPHRHDGGHGAER